MRKSIVQFKRSYPGNEGHAKGRAEGIKQAMESNIINML